MSEYEAKAVKPKVSNPQLGPQAMETVWALVPQPLQQALGWQVVEEVFRQMRSTRLTGRVSTSVVRSLWIRLGEYPPSIVRDGIEVFLAQHYTKEERYLVGIIRSEAKRIARAERIGKAETRAAATRPMSKGLPQAVKHLERIVTWLREVYASLPLDADQREVIVDVAKAVQLGAAACKTDDCPDARILDEACEGWQQRVQDNVPEGVDVPAFSPYNI